MDSYRYREDQVDQAATWLLERLGLPGCVGLSGPMGSGKTTLVAALCRRLGAVQQVSSPTFTLLNIYPSPQGEIWHADAWRLEHPDEALELGLLEWIERPIWGFIEWVERIGPWFPPDRPVVEIESLGPQERILRLIAYI